MTKELQKLVVCYMKDNSIVIGKYFGIVKNFPKDREIILKDASIITELKGNEDKKLLKEIYNFLTKEEYVKFDARNRKSFYCLN